MDQPMAEGLFDRRLKEFTTRLQSYGQITEISGKFAKLKTDEQRAAFILSFENISDIFSLSEFPKPEKSSSVAVKLRNEGNAHFKKVQYNEALRKYSESVSFAPAFRDDEEGKRSELSLAYANRSAVLLHLNHHRLCLTDIQLSLETGYPPNLQYKLQDRAGKCYLYLGQTAEAETSFKQSLDLLEKARLDKKRRDTWVMDLKNFIKQCQKYQEGREESSGVTDTVVGNKIPELSEGSHQTYTSLSSVCKVVYTPEQGRYLVANRDIKPGEVILVEKPYAAVLLPEQYSTHCHHCLSRSVAPLPCPNCPATRFCSLACRQEACSTYHWYECPTLDVLHKSGVGKFGHLALRALTVSSLEFLLDYRKTLSREVSVSKELEGCNSSGKYEGEDYNAIYHLVTHDSDRTVSDLFRRAVMAVFLLQCLKRSSFLDVTDMIPEGSSSDVESYIAGLLLTHLQAFPCNAHEISELQFNQDSVAESLPVELGAGIYATLSLFNHSCDPTVNRNFYMDQCVVRAISVIREGEEISDNYGAVYAVQTRAERHRKLEPQYYFRCGCEPCTLDWPLYPSIEHQQPAWRCDSCWQRLPPAPNVKDLLPQCPGCQTRQDVLEKRTTLEESQARADEAFEVLLKGDVLEALPVFLNHLEVMSRLVLLPWRNYNICQEAVKQCYSILGNCHVVAKCQRQ